MALTFKSTGMTQVTIIEQDADGTRRVACAVRDDANHGMWRVGIGQPSGNRPCSNVYGSMGDAELALTHYLHATRSEWLAEKARGHRPEQSMMPDRNVRIDERGHAIGEPDVTNYLKR